MRLKKLRIALLLAVVLAAPEVAGNQTWREVARTPQQTTYLAPGSIEKTADSLRFWALIDHASPQKQFRSDRLYRSTRMQREVRCDARTMAISRWELFELPGAGGKLVGEFVVPEAAFHYSPVAPGSDDEALLQSVCPRTAG